MGSAVAALAAIIPVQAWADSAGAAEVDELVVTALRREQNLQEVPAAISAVSGASLAARGVTQVEGLQFLAPSMSSGKLLGQTAISIRGVGLNPGAPGVAVAVHVDGVFQPSASMGDLMQIDLERVEVLRGPQGTLYGRNANGGAVNFITKAPTDRFEGYVLGGYATYNESKLQALVNLPVGPAVRSRLVLDWTKRREGFVKSSLSGGQDVDKGDTLSGRLRVSADLSDNLALDLSGAVVSGRGPTQYFVLREMPNAATLANNPVLTTAAYDFRPWRTTANDPMSSHRDFWSGSGTLTWTRGDLKLRSITGYSHLVDDFHNDDDGISVSVFPVRRYSRSGSFSQELNGSYSAGQLDLVAGLFYFHDNLEHLLAYDVKEGAYPLPPQSALVFRIPKYKTEAYAAYVDATARVTERLKIFGGVRASRETQSITQQNWLTFGPTPPFDTCPAQTNKETFNSTTPRVGVSYEPGADLNLYATLSKGYKAGGFNLYGCNNAYAPEKLTAYETGLKGRFLGGGLTLNASAFYYDYTDLQVSQVIGLARFITNAGAAQVKGLELEGAAHPDVHWSLEGNVTLLDAKYTRFTNIDGLDPARGPQNLKGKRLNRSPEVSSNLGLAYRTGPTEHGAFTARLDASYRSKTYYREFNEPQDAQNGYVLLNANLMWDSADGRYRVRLYGSNLTNQPYIAALDSSDAFGSRFITWGAPRQVGVEVRYGF